MWHGAGPSPDLQAGCQEGYFLLLCERASHPKGGTRISSSAPTGRAPSRAVPSGRAGGEGGAAYPPLRLLLLLVLPTHHSPPSLCRLLLPLPLLWLLRHTPQSRQDGGAGPRDPPASSRTPPGIHTHSSRTGGSPRCLGSAPAWLPAAPAVTGKEKAGGPERGQGARGRAQEKAGDPLVQVWDLGRDDSSPP